LESCDETSPRICKPYFQVKQAVSPHIEPYYDAYAAPYVDLAKPYYNTLDRTVISPGLGYAAKYGAPQVLKAQAYSKVQWENIVQPQLLKYQVLLSSQYDKNLAPRVDTVSNVIAPYYDIARTNALQTYHELLLPSYEFLQPYAQRSYQVAASFTTDTAMPSAVWVWNQTYFLLDGIVWPQVRSLYVENVEPQLHKIGQRLGRYHGKQNTQKPAVEAITRYVTTDCTRGVWCSALTVMKLDRQSSILIYQAYAICFFDRHLCKRLSLLGYCHRAGLGHYDS
jgi:hypothetical protein